MAANHFAFIASGGARFRMCGFAVLRRCGRRPASRGTSRGRSRPPSGRTGAPASGGRVRPMALALFTRMSMPPKARAASSTARAMAASSRTSRPGSACPGRLDSAATVWIVPGARVGLHGLGGDCDAGPVSRRAARSPPMPGSAGDEKGLPGEACQRAAAIGGGGRYWEALRRGMIRARRRRTQELAEGGKAGREDRAGDGADDPPPGR